MSISSIDKSTSFFDTERLARRFAKVSQEKRGAFIPFITAGDPSEEFSEKLLKALPAQGADIIELGMPFSDPVADGPAIQRANLRALQKGITIQKTLSLVARFRKEDQDTPVILMGYYNPIYSFGVTAFIEEAKRVGVDGFIIVDLPPEEDAELCLPAQKEGLHFIRLITPATDSARLASLTKNSSGFLYYVSITGITGTASAAQEEIETAVERIKKQTSLPVAVGFGIKTSEQVSLILEKAEAAVVGSAIINKIEEQVKTQKIPSVEPVLSFVKELAQGTIKK